MNLLTNRRLIINSFRIGSHENKLINASVLSDKFIYYEIIDSDYDGGKKLTSKDPKKLFISGLDGKAFIQISPKNYSVYSWKIDSRHDLVLMDLIKDLNGDKEFNEKDEVEHFMCDLKNETPAKPVFGHLFNIQVKELAKKIF